MRIARRHHGWFFVDGNRQLPESLESMACRLGYRVKALCDEVGTTEQNLRRIFLRDLGVGTSDWLRLERMVRARHLLRKHQSASQVSDLLGFSHPNSFRRAFQAVYQLTPDQFLRSESERAQRWLDGEF